MPFVPHPHFCTPPMLDQSIWRYMDLTKFLSMLERQALHFSRADELGDPFEGSYSRREIQLREEHTELTNIRLRSAGINVDINDDGAKEFNEYMLGNVAVNCWHLNPHESAAMWRLYADPVGGIVVRSSFDTLTRCFDKSVDRVYVGCVQYIDFDADPFTVGSRSGGIFNMIAPFLHKRRSFEHEREVRALITRDSDHKGDDYMDYTGIPDGGLDVAVDLGTLIEEVRVDPNSPVWFRDLVADVAKRYGFQFEVLRSSLRSKALY